MTRKNSVQNSLHMCDKRGNDFSYWVSQDEMGKISQLPGTIKRKPNSSCNLSVVRCTSLSFFTLRSVVKNGKGTSLCSEKLQNVLGNT
jgi:hypothetical protein